MNRRFFLQLVVPLTTAVVLSGLVHLRWPADGFFLNLAAGFVGSLVTIGYIDWVLRLHEKAVWSGTDSRINARLSALASGVITGIRSSFGYGTNVFDRDAMATGDVKVMRLEVLRIATHLLAPSAVAKISAMTQEQWPSFAAHLQHSSAQCGLMLDRYGHRLSPALIENLIDLQGQLESAQTYWRLLPDVAGVHPTQMPKMKSSAEEVQKAWSQLTARDVSRILELSVSLSTKTSEE
jgi:hypothetical protein